MYLLFYCTKLCCFSDSAVAILPVSVRLIDKSVNRKFSVNRLTVNITSLDISDSCPTCVFHFLFPFYEVRSTDKRLLQVSSKYVSSVIENCNRNSLKIE